MRTTEHYEAARQFALALTALDALHRWCRVSMAEQVLLLRLRKLQREFTTAHPEARNPYDEVRPY